MAAVAHTSHEREREDGRVGEAPGGRLHVEAANERLALLLIDELSDAHAELAPAHGIRCVVHVDLEDKKGRRLEDALAAVERWLSGTGVAMTAIEFGGCRYAIERQTG